MASTRSTGHTIFSDIRDLGGGWSTAFGRVKARFATNHNQRVADIRLPWPAADWTAQVTFHTTESAGVTMLAFELSPPMPGPVTTITVKAQSTDGQANEHSYFCDYQVICRQQGK